MLLRVVLSTAIFLTFTATRLSIAAATAPSTAPAIVEVRLEDPLNGDAKSFLDLDSGKTFPFSEYRRESFIRESGADLMCETRDPTEGFAAHGLALLAIPTCFDQPPSYNEIVQQLSKVEPARFAMIPLKTFPATYLFRTESGTHGVLEISALAEKPAGLRLRYQIVTRPRIAADPVLRRGTPMAVRVQQTQTRIFLLKQKNSSNEPAIRSLEAQLQIMKQLANLEAAAGTLEWFGIRANQLESSFQMALAARGDVMALQRQRAIVLEKNEAIQRQLRLAELAKAARDAARKGATQVTTQPVPLR